jgi:AcrR family transcriptional regulator
MRDIAEVAGISPGNLTYHFRKREEIILKLYYQFYEPFQKTSTTSPSHLD